MPVFIGAGPGAIHKLGVSGEDLEGVTNALDLIAGYKDGSITTVPARVAVIGAGNTAIDAAIAAVRLGATEVYMLYRRGVRSRCPRSPSSTTTPNRKACEFHWNRYRHRYRKA